MNEDPWFFVLGFASTALYALSLALYCCLRNRSLLSASLFEEKLNTSAQEAAWDLGEQLPHAGGELRQWDDQLRRRGRRCDGHIFPRRHCLVQDGSKKHSPTFEIQNRGKDKENVAGILLQVRRSSPARSLGDPAHALDVEHHLLILGFLKC